MIPNRFVFSTSSMTSEMLHSDHRPPSRSQPRRSANAVQDTAIHLLQSFARSAHALFAKRPVHVRTRRASLSFDLDTEYQDTTFSPRRQPIALSGRLPTDVTEASAAGTHSHRTSLDDSSSGLTLNVSEVQARTIAVAQGRPKSEDTDTLSGSASGRSESGEGEELQFGYSADVESSQEEEQGVATGDSVLLITRARAIMEAEESRRTAVDRRSLEVVPPTPRDGNDDSYHSRYSNPTMPPLPSLPQATFVPPPRRVSEKEKAPKYRTRPPPALPRLPPSDPNLPSHENTPPSSKSSQEGTPSSSNLSGQPKKRESPRSPFTTARRLHLSPSVDSLSLYLPRPPKNSAATPVPQMYRSTPPPRSISTPRTAYTSGPPPNAFSAPFYNPHSPPTSFSAPFHSPHSPTTPYTPSFSPEFRNPHSPPNTSVDPSDPQLLFPASVRGAGYNPFQHSRSFSDGSILPPHSA
ncbi:hypothetical protein BV25DRAFT_1912960 [Artomyces pyxidatus]|uniref:Uncharacterized protein n=1 Tax=Artomyces pyxidatus TaxID=48021 RepID=A0ACB8TCY5_9AGAM|nr:hypothetical protein BV25DRAFT_1912960 [Artomyces pyxidatus]